MWTVIVCAGIVKVRGGVGKQLLLEHTQRRVGRAGGAGLDRGLHAAVIRHVEQDARRAPAAPKISLPPESASSVRQTVTSAPISSSARTTASSCRV